MEILQSTSENLQILFFANPEHTLGILYIKVLWHCIDVLKLYL